MTPIGGVWQFIPFATVTGTKAKGSSWRWIHFRKLRDKFKCTRRAKIAPKGAKCFQSLPQKRMADEKKAEVKQAVPQERRRRRRKPKARGGYKLRKDGLPRNKPSRIRRSILARLRIHVKETYGDRPNGAATIPRVVDWANREIKNELWQEATPDQKIKDVRQVVYQKRYADTPKGVLKNQRRKQKAKLAREAQRALEEEESDEGGEEEGGEEVVEQVQANP